MTLRATHNSAGSPRCRPFIVAGVLALACSVTAWRLGAEAQEAASGASAPLPVSSVTSAIMPPADGGVAPSSSPPGSLSPTALRNASRAQGASRARQGRAAQRAMSNSVNGLSGMSLRTNRLEPEPLRRYGAPPLTPPPEPPRRKRVEDDPFAAVGLRAGNMIWYPAAEVETGYDTNPNRIAGTKKGSPLVKPMGEMRWQSDWLNHSMDGHLRGTYYNYTNVDGANRPEVDGRSNFRLDVTRDTTFLAETRLHVDTQSPQTANFQVTPAERPLVTQFGGTLAANQNFGRFTLGLRGTVDRYIYENAKLPDGTISIQSDRNMNQYGTALRLSYEALPGVKPFVEARLDTRVYDQEIDQQGLRRSSVGTGGRVGTSFELTRTLTGEVSAGPEVRRYEDDQLKELRGIVGDASLIWNASALTTVTLRGASSLDETTVTNSNGVVSRRASLEINHALFRDLTISAVGSFNRSDYRGTTIVEDTMSGTLRLDYKLTRSLAVTGSFTHERFHTTSQSGGDYTANVFLVGLRLQR